MTFTDYYDQLSDVSPKEEFKGNLLQNTGISNETYYRWMREPGKIPMYGKLAISSLIKKPVDILFPNSN